MAFLWRPNIESQNTDGDADKKNLPQQAKILKQNMKIYLGETEKVRQL